MSIASSNAWYRKPTTAILAAVAAGLYPILFYYSTNWALVNSWEHLGYFLGVFIGVPLLLLSLAQWVSNRFLPANWARLVLPFLNMLVFLWLLMICLYAGVEKKIALGIIVIAGLAAFLLKHHFKKIVGIQFILAGIGLITLVPEVLKHKNFATDWLSQPDAIEETMLTHTPNIYFIQPDGYVNPSELRRGYYDADPSEMTSYFASKSMKYYPNFRSNYPSTLTSNTSMFAMKHHYYNRGESFNEGVHLRDLVVTDNAVLRILKNNNYETHLLLERPYLLLNRPTLGYDHCNFDYNDISYVGTGLGKRRELTVPLLKWMDTRQEDQPQFFFIEIFDPGHIATAQEASEGITKEKEKWFVKLADANEKLKEIVSLILDKDPQALIIISADHGGFVGMEYTRQIYRKTQDRDLIYSMFSSLLAIHWPDAIEPKWDGEFRSSVNLFRIIFAELSENPALIEQLQPDRSFVILNEGAINGCYAYIDEKGAITLEAVTNDE